MARAGAIPREPLTHLGSGHRSGLHFGNPEGRGVAAAKKPREGLQDPRCERGRVRGSSEPSRTRPLPCTPWKGGSKPKMPSSPSWASLRGSFLTGPRGQVWELLEPAPPGPLGSSCRTPFRLGTQERAGRLSLGNLQTYSLASPSSARLL